jgi:hypothetical protein
VKNSDMKCVTKSIAGKVDSGEYRVANFPDRGYYYGGGRDKLVNHYSLGVFDGDTLIATATTFSATLYDARRQRVMVKWTCRLNQAMLRALQRQDDYSLNLDRLNEERMMHRLVEKHCL